LSNWPDASILIVDDQEVDARLVEDMLRGSGYSAVMTTSDPRAAIELHRKHAFDLVILDVLMPGMDGFGVLARLHAVDAEVCVPVIMVTADPEFMKRALEAGAHDFIGKPVRLVELRSRVRNALELSLLARDAKARGRLLALTLHERTADLQEAEGRFQALVEQSLTGIYIVEEGRFTYANPRLCEWLGYTLEELRDIPSIDLVHEDDRAQLLENRRLRQAGMHDELTSTFRLMRRDGRFLHMRASGKMIELKGRLVLLGVAEDVTERVLAVQSLRESEEKYRLLWETTTDAVVLLDDDMTILYANPSVAQVFGYAAQEVEGRKIEMLQPPRLRDRHREAMRRYLATGERKLDWRATETTGLHRQGHEIPIEIAFSHVAIGGKSIFAGFMRDISPRKRAQAALESANKSLRSLSERMLAIQEEERRHISRELHDDVGQSLLALGIGLHRLEKFVDASHRGLLAECVAVTAAVQEKLRELSVQLHPPHLDQLGLGDALSWLVNRHREMTGMNIEFRVNGEDEPRALAAVEGACFRICQEALNNATRHARAGRVIVELKREQSRLEVSIADDGIGFNEPLQREAMLASGSLGLISMEERARLAGGRLELRTGPGSGTTVTASFPEAARQAESAGAGERVRTP
jgi:PAS domain S-box-containing protein